MLTDAADNSSAAPNASPRIEVTTGSAGTTIALGGRWTSHGVHLVDDDMRKLQNQNGFSQASIDLTDVVGLDTAGAWLIERLSRSLKARNISVTLHGMREAWRPLLEAVGEAVDRNSHVKRPKRRFFVIDLLESLGKMTYSARDDFLMSMHILGATIRGSQMKLGRGSGINFAAITNQIDRMGVGAIPVILLMSTIIGAIIAQQGAFQLRYFGAEIFVVDLVGILVLREIGVLLTAIMVAGRSGSAITAEIGSMKMREETDALTVIGLNPVGVLVFPRLVALVIVLPLLTIIADLASLAGAGFVVWTYSGISPDAFLVRLRDAIDISTYLAGLIKAPFMAMIIGIMASVEGMKVGGSAESLGRRVTASVVKSIFVVIVVDGMFAMFYAAINF
ncbi:organic solvent ABC transporter permease [Phyllobacterium phragmitis]|uniref:Organic solvent ABC transporter permease n=1 Tax=Phyllobacterium phragmitis TaxID=2670329 RepID=A0A2S9IM52_9HYPH|nr:ABC transporter permease [Phyllobacterium phragmitis]PRD41552.1 organic solvent ABC transporter permease [Phyllobacterium phragmitis]